MNKKHINKKNKIHKKWFDKECLSLKDKSRQFAKLNTKTPGINLYFKNTEKYLINTKGYAHSKNTIFGKRSDPPTKLEQTLSSDQDFWETLGRNGF